MPGSGAPVRHVWGAASREIPPARPNHNLDGFRVLLKTLRGFVFTLRPTCLWRARSASLQQLRGLCSAGDARSASFGELLESRLPLEAALPQPPSPPSESFSGFGFSTSLSFGCCWRRLLNLLRKSSSGFCRWRRSLNLLQIARSTSLHFGATQEALAQPPSSAGGGALAQPAVSCRWRRSLNLLGELFRLPLETLLNLLELSLLLEALAQPPCSFSCRLTRDRGPPIASLSRQLQPKGPTPNLRSRPAPMASLSRPAPNGNFIKGFSQFIKASSNQKGRPKTWPSEAQSAIAPHKQFINGRPQSSIEAGPDGKFIKASPQ